RLPAASFRCVDHPAGGCCQAGAAGARHRQPARRVRPVRALRTRCGRRATADVVQARGRARGLPARTGQPQRRGGRPVRTVQPRRVLRRPAAAAHGRSAMNAIERARQTFFGECRDLLVQMEEGIALLSINPGDRNALDAVFRAAHTIKGSGGLFELDELVGFTHRLEGALDHVREGRLALSAGSLSLLLQCRDHLEGLVDSAISGAGPDAGSEGRGNALLERLSVLPNMAGTTLAEAIVAPPTGAEDGREDGADTWHISVRFGEDLFRKGLTPVPVLRYLGSLGVLVHVTTLVETMPAAERMDPESCYLGLEIRMRSQAGKAEIEDAFEFVRDDCELRMLPPGSRIDDYLRLISELPEDPGRLGGILLACGAITERELSTMLADRKSGE